MRAAMVTEEGFFPERPGYPDLLVKLLRDPNTYEWDLDDIVDLLAEIPAGDVGRSVEIFRLRQAFVWTVATT